MKTFLLWAMSPLWVLATFFAQPDQPETTLQTGNKILVFSATRGFRHASIPDGIKAIGMIAAKNNWKMVASEDSSVFNSENLKQFSAIVLLNTTGNVFGSKEEAALQQYVKDGGGIVGVHAAADCEYDWPWYNQLIGGYFESHPATQSATLVVKERHPATAHLGSSWIHKDEWYNYKSVSPSIKVLLELDEKSYEGGKMGASHPIAWYQEFDGGRLFYTGLGHTSETYQDEKFLMHVTEGIRWAMKKK
ncbi:MAG: ThuA domain-containing protein [Flavipsychrobacter sp.]|nr:ThuA domain-containing protein [Flavipsychrobacter sp.]